MLVKYIYLSSFKQFMTHLCGSWCKDSSKDACNLFDFLLGTFPSQMLVLGQIWTDPTQYYLFDPIKWVRIFFNSKLG